MSGDGRNGARGDVRRRLDDAGRRAVPEPGPAFADALEARLAVVAGSLPPVPPEPPPSRITGRWRVTAMAGVLAVVAFAIVLASGALGPAPLDVPAPLLANPVNVEVALADGTVLEDPDGLLLPDGAVVTVHAGGSARVGTTVLEPGDVVTVRGGRLVVTGPSPVGREPVATTGGSPSPHATGRPEDSPGPRPTSTPSPRPTVTRAPTAPPTRSPDPTGTPAPRPSPTVAATRQPSPTPSPTPATLRPRLRARLVTGPRIAVRWSATWGAGSYVLLATLSRSGPAADPVPGSARVLGEFAVPPERALRIRVPDRVVEVKLRVLALRADGTLLRRSRIVTIEIPSDTTGETTPEPAASATPEPLPTDPAGSAPVASLAP